MIGLWLSRNLLPALTFGITIPLWLIIAAGLWVHFDKASTVRQAVNKAVSDLVHSAELEAAKAREEGLRKIIAEKERRAERDAAAVARFSVLLADAESERETLNDDITNLTARVLSDGCVVDADLLDLLRR